AHRSCAACRPCRRAPPGWARGRLLLGTGVISPSCQPHEWLPRQRPPFPQLRLPPRPHRSQLSRRWRSERRGAVMGGWGAAGGTSPGRAGRRGRWGMSLSLVFLAGWWSACARHDSGDVTRSAPTGGAEGSGGDAPVEPSEPPVEASCPSTEPVPSSACDRAGMRCSYGASSEDFLCTRDGRWKRRTFVPGEGGGPAILTDQPELVDCSELDIAECASHPQCSSV